MASTTLMTFIMQAPPSTKSVHLFGSWDNFSKAYQMERDPRTSHLHWRGCHSFTNIICDGDLQLTPRRDGGLKMGGVYWYYYQLDDDLDYHNLSEPSTTSCPLLPGQRVNILEVPMQMKTPDEVGRRRSTSSVSLGFTLNPNDKFLTPKPPKALSHLRRTSSTSSVEDVFKRRKAGLLQEYGPSPPKNVVDRSRFHKLRPSISVPALQLVNPLKPAACTESNLRWQATWSSSGPVEETQAADCLDSRPGSSRGQQSVIVQVKIGSQPGSSVRPDTHTEPSAVRSQWSKRRSDLHITLPQDGAVEDVESSLLARMCDKVTDLRIDTAVSSSQVPSHDATLEVETVGHTELFLSANGLDEKLQNRRSIFSSAPSSCFSPSMESTIFNGSHLSQPETPIMSDFGEEFLGTFETFELPFNKADAVITSKDSKLNVYSLPEVEYASVLTLQNLPVATSKATYPESIFESEGGNQLVESWNDGSEHRKSALDDLFDDLSYLRGVIV